MRRGGSVGRHARIAAAALLIATPSIGLRAEQTSSPPAPQAAVRPILKAAPVTTERIGPSTPGDPAAAEASRLKRIGAARSWGYQLNGASVDKLAASPFDLLVIDATRGFSGGQALTWADVERLKKKPDGSRRIVLSYLSIGEAEDYRLDYFAREYLEEDPPDWLLHENPDWRGNRLVNICAEGWQRTILGDERGRSVYDSVQASPLYRLLELGLDGVYLDRVDVYAEIKAQCPNGAERMADFVVRIAAHARKANAQFLVVQQNAEDLLQVPRVVKAIDAVAKESLFFGWGGGETPGSLPVNSAEGVRWSVERLARAKAAGRAIFTVDYPASKTNGESALKRSRELGFVPYIAPKELHELWLPGKQF